MRSRAIALGWRDDQIIVIDSDQGESGASAAWREGFQRLVTEVGMGRAGIVMGLEVSRLARNNADWHRLLEICALADTLILDEDGVYDPASFNDRLLLGLKGTMSEAELHVLKARLRGGILNKVRRGEYRCPLPTGLVYDEAGNVVLDPDAQIRDTIAHFFETFSRVGSACQTVKVFRKEGLQLSLPTARQRHACFRPLTASTAMRVLNNPRYAGAYVYGRRRYRRAADGKKKIQRKARLRRLARLHPERSSRLHQLGAISAESRSCSRPMVEDTKWRERRRREKARRCCRDARCAVDAAGISASDTLARRGKQEAWYVCDRAHRQSWRAGLPVDRRATRR